MQNLKWKTIALAVLVLSSKAMAACPGYTGHVTFQDYDGPVTFTQCVSWIQITSGNIYLTLYDNESDGIFRNGFEGEGTEPLPPVPMPEEGEMIR